jgi:hypothetical protein
VMSVVMSVEVVRHVFLLGARGEAHALLGRDNFYQAAQPGKPRP